MTPRKITTAGGIQLTVSERPLSLDTALDPILARIDTRKGAIFSSGFDFPGRHSRWDLGFVDPALEFVTRGREFFIRALNLQGHGLLEVIAGPLSRASELDRVQVERGTISGLARVPDRPFSEEERSRQSSVFSALRIVWDLFKLPASDPVASHFGFYGAFGYDLIFQFEDISLKQERKGDSDDCHLYLPLQLTVVDRKKETASELTLSVATPLGMTHELAGGGETFPLVLGQDEPSVQSDHPPGAFANNVRHVVEGTRRGDYFEVVLSQTFSSSFQENPTALFRRLSKLNPSPYLFLIQLGSEQLLGSSPEIFLRVAGDRIETCPIAGTIARGESALEDAERVMELLGSAKDDSELTMCTDVDRNDLARVCVPGSVKVIGRRQVEFYSHLIHTVDHVAGTLDPKYDALDAFQTHMWACTVTGAPKPAALQEIENLELSPRGWYSGAVGMLCFDGGLNTGITLRTAVLRDGRAQIRAGATLLFESSPEAEEEETRTKARAFLTALTSGSNKSAEEKSTQESQTRRKPRTQSARRILLVDYRDSFVHNLASYFRELGAEVTTMRPGFSATILDELKPDLVVLSPGPFSPSHFGIPEFVRGLAERKLPTFGVCLGHQGIGEAFGARLGVLPFPMHGKMSVVRHTGTSIFEGVDPELETGRYHSLYIIEESLPNCLEVLARSTVDEVGVDGKGVIMSVRHKTLPIAGVQFHPESLLTLKRHAGHMLIENVLKVLCSK